MTTSRKHGDDEWSPATSAPGEIFTPEGQIKQAGAFARGLKNDDPRAKAYRRSMMKPGLVIVGIAVGLMIALMVGAILF